jgi:DNA-binding response OmpR family regulator
MAEKMNNIETIRTELANIRRKVVRLETLLKDLELEPDSQSTGSDEPKLPASILIVDDDDQVRRLLNRLLETAGYNPIEAERGREAIVVLEENDVDLMLLDINLRVGSGIEVLRILRRRQIEVPTIIISGYVSTGVTEQLMELGVDNIMAKPFHTDRILEEIEKTLRS